MGEYRFGEAVLRLMAHVDERVAEGIENGISREAAHAWRVEVIQELMLAARSGDYKRLAAVVEGVAGEEGEQLVWDIAGEEP